MLISAKKNAEIKFHHVNGQFYHVNTKKENKKT
ncbi:hypothetical protein HDC90_001904 [Pedobacter sp. AK013]|nr:hypothetical protein [Pedobacter sp. AK013]